MDQIKDLAFRAWAEEIYNKLKDVGIEVGARTGEEHLAFSWSTGWTPPGGAVISRLDGTIRLWINDFLANKEIQSDLKSAFGDDWQSQLTSPRVSVTLADGASGVIGAQLGESFLYDEQEQRWRPQAIVEGYFRCGNITAKVKVQVRDAFLSAEPGKTSSSEVTTTESGSLPSILQAAASVQAAARALDEARAAVKTALTQIDRVFSERRLCASPKPSLDEVDPTRVRVLIPIFEQFGWTPKVTPGWTREEATSYYPDDPEKQASLMSDEVTYSKPDLLEGPPASAGDQFIVKATGRLSYAENAALFEALNHLYPGEIPRLTHDRITPEEGHVVLELDPLLASVSVGQIGMHGAGEGRARSYGEVLGTMYCGELRIEFALARYGPPHPVSEDEAAYAALQEALHDEGAKAARELLPEIRKRVESFANAVKEAGIPCPTDEVFAEAKAEAAYRLLDGNAAYGLDVGNGTAPAAAALADHRETRIGAAADGSSLLVVEVEAPSAGSVTLTLADAADGALLPLNWSFSDAPRDPAPVSVTVSTREVDGRHLAHALYRPPVEFGGRSDRRIEGIAVRAVHIAATLPGGGSLEVPLMLARPPAVLVHGTYSTPERWRESSGPLGGKSMVEALAAEGIRSFLVDYQATNGGTSASATFEDNALVVLGPPVTGEEGGSQGIRQALDFYRTTLGLAVTRVDVVGHSLGGLLARVYASPAYQKDGAPAYLRAENWQQGDIHRLVTLCTPHYGSDLPEVITRLKTYNIAGQGFVDWALTFGFSEFAAYKAGLSNGAAADQRPQSPALVRIGASAIPSHVIGCAMDYAEMTRTLFDDPARSARNGEYARQFLMLTTFLGITRSALDVFSNPVRPVEGGTRAPSSSLSVPSPLAQVLKSLAETGEGTGMSTAGADLCKQRPGSDIRMGIDDQERMIALLEEVDWQASVARLREALPASLKAAYPDRLSFAVWAAAGYYLQPKCGTAWICTYFDFLGDQPKIDAVALMQMVRALIFGNTPNDGVVRLESQLGGIDPRTGHASVLEKVVHGEAPLYGKVQAKVVALLTGPQSAFADALPPAGAQPVDLPPGIRDQPARERIMAIALSNMVPAHAEAFARVAHARNEIILVRPVNPDATRLILNGAGTKSMHVKGKSANWGPHAGYIPVDQSYSKLALVGAPGERLHKAKVYNCEVVETFTKAFDPEFNKEIARRRPLVLTFDGAQFDALRVTNAPPLPEQPRVVLRSRDSGRLVDWRNRNIDLTAQIRIEDTSPLEVLTTPPGNGVPDGGAFLTADYDLLAVGTTYTRWDDPVGNDKERGSISQCQIELVSELNRAVAVQTGYRSGDVVHHGPESQFQASPGNDYPITVFEPGRLGGWIRTIHSGPKGAEDEPLQRYFLSKYPVERTGWTLHWNENWKWGTPDPKTGTFPRKSTPKEGDSDDNDGQTKAKAECDPLPPCGSGVTGGDRALGSSAPDALGCWPG